jgi:hypothetical protein
MDGILKLPGAVRRDLILLIVVKLAMLSLLYWLCFSPSHRPHVDMMGHIIGTMPAP